MVAVALVVSVVIVIGILQSQSDSFGEFSDNQRNSASCSISHSRFCSAYSGSGSPSGSASDIKSDANSNDCDWADPSASAPFGCN